MFHTEAAMSRPSAASVARWRELAMRGLAAYERRRIPETARIGLASQDGTGRQSIHQMFWSRKEAGARSENAVLASAKRPRAAARPRARRVSVWLAAGMMCWEHPGAPGYSGRGPQPSAVALYRARLPLQQA